MRLVRTELVCMPLIKVIKNKQVSLCCNIHVSDIIAILAFLIMNNIIVDNGEGLNVSTTPAIDWSIYTEKLEQLSACTGDPDIIWIVRKTPDNVFIHDGKGSNSNATDFSN